MGSSLTGPASRVVLVDPTTQEPYAATGVAGGPAVTEADGANVALGATDDAAVVNPASDGSVVALLKGILTELLAGNVLLNDIKTNTTPP